MKQIRFMSLFFICIISMIGCSPSPENTKESMNSSHNIISVTDFSNREIKFTEPPKNIVALGNGEVDILYALGLSVVGRPNGDSPIEAADNALEVGSTHSIDLERVTSLLPDIVLGNNPMNTNDIPAIEKLDAEMILTSANSVDEIKQQIDLFGQLFNKKDRATEIIQSIDDKITQLQSTKADNPPRVLLIYGAPGTNMAALSNSLTGNILEIVGGENIANDYPTIEMYPQYAQLNTEKVIESDPQIILFMGHGNPESVKDSFKKELEKAAGWSELDAVKNDRFYILPPTLFGTNPGTKITDSLDYLHDLLQQVSHEGGDE